MHILQVPAEVQSEELEQESPHTAAATGVKISSCSHLCWQVLSIQILQVSAVIQSEELAH